MEYEIYNVGGELYHHGTKGMRWGIRRYQNKDGSLTPAGKRRLKKESDAIKKEEAVLKNQKATKAKFDRLSAKRKSLEEQKKALDDDNDKNKKNDPDNKEPAKKSMKDMSDDELMTAIRRAQMEKQYEALTAQPETINGGKAFVKDFMVKSAVPALQEAGRTLMKDALLKAGKKYLGLETENADDYVEKLGKEVKKMNLEKQFKKLKEEDAAEKEAQKKDNSKTDDGNPKDNKPKDDTSKDNNSKSESQSDKVYEGTVEGFGTNSKTTNQGRKWTSDSKVFDADWYEVVNNDHTSSGRSYVSDYLALPAPGLPAPRDDD